MNILSTCARLGVIATGQPVENPDAIWCSPFAVTEPPTSYVHTRKQPRNVQASAGIFADLNLR